MQTVALTTWLCRLHGPQLCFIAAVMSNGPRPKGIAPPRDVGALKPGREGLPLQCLGRAEGSSPLRQGFTPEEDHKFPGKKTKTPTQGRRVPGNQLETGGW